MSAVKQLCYESRAEIYQQFFVLCNEIGLKITQYRNIKILLAKKLYFLIL